MANTQKIPKKIWILWLQGWDSVPEIVNACAHSWEVHNPGWQVVRLERANLLEYINLEKFISNERITVQAFSDILRVSLLSKYGGVWVDASVFCTQPLDEWIHEAVKPSGFWGFSGRRKDYMVPSWFLVAKSNNYIARAWADRILSYWSSGYEAPRLVLLIFHRIILKFFIKIRWYSIISKPLDFYKHVLGIYPYFWVMYLFNSLYRSDPVFKDAFDAVQTTSALEAHRIHSYGIQNKVTDEIKDFLENYKLGIHKLDCRLSVPKDSNTIIGYLIANNK